MSEPETTRCHIQSRITLTPNQGQRKDRVASPVSVLSARNIYCRGVDPFGVAESFGVGEPFGAVDPFGVDPFGAGDPCLEPLFGLVPLSRAGLLSGTVLLFCIEPFSMDDEPLLVPEPFCGLDFFCLCCLGVCVAPLELELLASVPGVC